MSFLNEIKKKSILVVGDVMLDTYFTGEVKRISPEAPVPVFRKKGEHSVLGGAANVAANLVAAGQKVAILTMVGRDESGEQLRAGLEEKGIDTALVFALDRSTTVKTRFLAGHDQQVMRLDVEDTQDLDPHTCQAMLAALEKRIGEFDLVLLSDYMKGLLTFEFTQGVIRLAREKGIPTLVDVKDPKVDKYCGATLLKPNRKELEELTGMPASDLEETVAASCFLRKTCACEYVLTTRGSKGMVLVGAGEPYSVPCTGQEVFDVTGAGDTTIAYLSACIANGAAMEEAVDIANCAAGIQVGKVGTSCVYWHEVRERLADGSGSAVHKRLSGAAVAQFRNDHSGQKIVFTNGCFDILHMGHVRYLREAAKLGDILVLGLNSDASVKRLKGEDRPVNDQEARAEVLCALSFIDYVVIFDEDTPYELIKAIQPDVLVKGGDYNRENVVGVDIVEARGGKLALIPFVEGRSTTNIIEKIRQ